MRGVAVSQVSVSAQHKNEVHSISSVYVNRTYRIRSESWLNCVPSCNEDDFHRFKFIPWIHADSESYEIQLFAERELSRLLPDSDNIGRSFVQIFQAFSNELKVIFPSIRTEFLIYLVPENARLALRSDHNDSEYLSVTFAFPMMPPERIQERFLQASSDPAFDSAQSLSEEGFALFARGRELVGVHSTLAHELTHVHQDIQLGEKRLTQTWRPETSFNKEVVADMVGMFMEALLFKFLKLDVSKTDGVLYSLNLPMNSFPNEEVRNLIDSTTSHSEVLKLRPLQQYIAAANIAACLGAPILSSKEKDLNRVRNLIVSALNSEHDFSKSFFLPKNICRTEVGVSGNAESDSSVH